ncbi:MAG: alanine racemase [Thermincolia bacterium]
MHTMYNRPVWAEINLRAIAHNVRELRRVTSPGAKVMAVVKANGYGHGDVEVARVALASGAERLGVAILSEGIKLRKAGFGVPILIFGYTPVELAADGVKNNLTQTVWSWEMAEAVSWAAVQQRKTARIHIKVDTGMGRIGYIPGEAAVAQILKIAKLPNLVMEGIFSHLATADSRNKSFAEVQFKRFQDIVNRLRNKGLEIPIKHLANSAATIELLQTHLDMVRPGISIYGFYPSDEVERNIVNLKPALSLKAHAAYVKDVPAGTPISYGCTHIIDKTTRIMTIPLGYADGYTRLLSSKGEVLVHGQRAPIVGRVCMDQCMADIGHIPDVKVGDEVVLIGRQGEQEITGDEVAAKIGTINYEVICMIGSRVPRMYI